MSVKYKTNGSIVTIPTGSSAPGGSNVWEGTAAEFEVEKDTIEPDTIVLITDDVEEGAIESTQVNMKDGKTLEDTINGFSFGEEEGKNGYYKDGEFFPFSEGSGEVKELLWVNPNPTDQFDTQTLSLDLSNYKQIIIEVAPTSTHTSGSESIVTVGDGKYYAIGNAKLNTNALNPHATRLVKAESDGIYFSYATNNEQTSTRGYAIPTKIYGIKNGIPSDINFVSEKITISTSVATKITLGFKPRLLTIINQEGTPLFYDENLGMKCYRANSGSNYVVAIPNTQDNNINSIDSDGFTMGYASNSSNVNITYYAYR